jgi:peptide deformylase
MDFKLGAHDSLTQVSTDWDFSNDGDAQQLEHAMIDFMIANKGIGLAANQIGISKRVFVMGSNTIEGFPAPFAVFNPRILEASSELVLDKEGCLSYPDLFLIIKRPSWIIAEYQDSEGNTKQIKADGYLSKCFQHEFDHLDGIRFYDKANKFHRDQALRKWKTEPSIIKVSA